MNKKVVGLGLATVAAVSLAACGHRGASKSGADSLKVAMVTDVGGVDDKSFNQSAWEGMQAWGKEHGYKKNQQFNYFQSANESDFATNINTAIDQNYNLVFGVGFALHDAIEDASKDNEDTNFVIIDDVIADQKNVASVTFADNEAGYLAGIAAAKTTKTKTVGFVGGQESEVISRFRAGFEAGVKSVDSSIKVKVNYVGSFGDPAKAKTIAQTQYADGADIIYSVAGASGAGVFQEAKAEDEGKNEADKVWVIGVDRDQKDDGNYKSADGKNANFVLASSIKEVGKALQNISNKTLDGKFPGGTTTVFGLKDNGVNLATTATSEDTNKAIEAAKEKIIKGEIKVPQK